MPVRPTNPHFWDRFVVRREVTRLPVKDLKDVMYRRLHDGKSQHRTISIDIFENEEERNIVLRAIPKKYLDAFVELAYSSVSDRTTFRLERVLPAVYSIFTDNSMIKAFIKSMELLCGQAKSYELSSKIRNPIISSVLTTFQTAAAQSTEAAARAEFSKAYDIYTKQVENNPEISDSEKQLLMLEVKAILDSSRFAEQMSNLYETDDVPDTDNEGHDTLAGAPAPSA